MRNPPMKLRCTRCHAPRDYDRTGETVRCGACGKKHHVDSLFVPVGGGEDD